MWKKLFSYYLVSTRKTQETAQFAVWEGMSSKENEGYKLAMESEETTSLSQPQRSGVPRGDEVVLWSVGSVWGTELTSRPSCVKAEENGL